ncbi:hypothetical protein DW206_22540 [Bacteroides ovatus]|jgi:hypothetical protein|uniref:Uncharacterized protein n=2 Tax=Bacteroides TaxID=816 RepID=A0A414WS76_BACOV|nr:hypothetical protein DWY24_14675 [Bacteroides ovatus]RHH40341.1 hypothetical protein DW206_22540 [Bacteroides ovatus]RHK58325.1 hypothetical protein DW055_20930 [Bacteroides ovatus]DAP51058.1 MAG TPA: hypothetical protein [Caudoviricetes sp.]
MSNKDDTMTNEEIEESLKEADEMINNFKEQEKQGLRDILRYYDRIHDKLFSFNNMLIAGYFVIIAMPNSQTNPWWILLPIFNMLNLVFVDYEMMEKSRFESAIMSKSQKEIQNHGKRISKTTWRSLFTIISTLIVTFVFVIQLIKLT